MSKSLSQSAGESIVQKKKELLRVLSKYRILQKNSNGFAGSFEIATFSEDGLFLTIEDKLKSKGVCVFIKQKDYKNTEYIKLLWREAVKALQK